MYDLEQLKQDLNNTPDEYKWLVKKKIRRARTEELWYKHMRNEPMTEEEIKEYGVLTGVLDE